MATENTAVTFSAIFLVKSPPNDARIAQLAQWGKRFREAGMVRETEGNLSFRTRLGILSAGRV